MYPKQGEWGNSVSAVLGQKVPTFPRDGRGEPSMQPSRNLHIVVSHRALRKGLRRSLQQVHLKGEASLPRGWDVALFFCSFLGLRSPLHGQSLHPGFWWHYRYSSG